MSWEAWRLKIEDYAFKLTTNQDMPTSDDEELHRAWTIELKEHNKKIRFRKVIKELKQHLRQREVAVVLKELENKLPSDTVNLISEFLK